MIHSFILICVFVLRKIIIKHMNTNINHNPIYMVNNVRNHNANNIVNIHIHNIKILIKHEIGYAYGYAYA